MPRPLVAGATLSYHDWPTTRATPDVDTTAIRTPTGQPNGCAADARSPPGESHALGV